MMVGKKVKALAVSVATITALWGQAPAVAGLIDPSDPNLVPFTINQGDFNTVSLNWATDFYGGTTYKVPSSPGQLQNYIVPYTGANGLSPNGAGIDAPYDSATGTAATNYYFQSGLTATGGAGCTTACNTFPDPGGAGQFTGDTGTTWDASISDLNTALGGKSAVFYFNMNETGDVDKLSGVDVLAWGKVTLHDNQGILPDLTFYLTDQTQPQGSGPDPSLGTCDVDPITPFSGNAGCATLSPNGTAYSTNADSRWTYTSGRFCVDDSGAAPVLLHFGACTNSESNPNATTITNNLGANQAAFAAWNGDLDSIIANNGCVVGGCYDVLQTDFRLSMTDNGFEQVFVAGNGTSPPPPGVPEPSSLALLVTALAGLGWSLRSRKRLSGTDGWAAQRQL